MLSFSVQIFLIALIVYVVLWKKTPLTDIPGPKAYPVFGNLLQLSKEKLIVSLPKFAKQYGGIFKLYILYKPVVVVSDHQFIHDALVKQSADFAGRPHSYRMQLWSWDYNEILFTEPGLVHRGRRRTVQTYLKQFGSGIQKLEDVTNTATDDLIGQLVEQDGRPIDVRDFFFKCLTDVVAILLIGETLSPKMSNGIKAILESGNEIYELVGIYLDWFPFLRFFGNKTYKIIMSYRSRAESIMMGWLEKKPSEGFINFMQSMSETERVNAFLDSRDSQIATTWIFLAAGVSTSSSTLTCLINVLCHYPDVQKKLRVEVMDVIGPARHPTLKDQDEMPYLRATILEIGRYASVAGNVVGRKCMRTCKLGKYTIPKDTDVWINLWAMHHDDNLWEEPFSFKPERFLDDEGQLVPADHPNRRNVMPFGAGHRVCVGEVFAVSRMFLIMARILQNFIILPESTLEKQTSCDPRNMKVGIVYQPPLAKVRMIPESD